MLIFRSNKTLLKAAAAGNAAEVGQCARQNTLFDIDINTRNKEGMTALNLAAKAGHLPVLDVLLKYQAQLEIADNDGHTPLMAAVTADKTEAALRLLRAGANPDAHEKGYIYPLHMAAYHGNLDIVKELVNKGADLNALILANGRTALHWAVQKENTAVIEALVKAGARTDIADKAGLTPRDLVKDKANAKYLMKLLGQEAPAQAVVAPPAVMPANDMTAPVADDSGDSWAKSGAQRLTHIGLYPDINRRITEIFNFETRERTVIAENLKSGAETLTAPESFDDVAEEALRKALAEFQRLGGSADESTTLGARAGKKMFKL